MSATSPTRIRRSPSSPKVLIEVTQELIEESKERSSSHCMIAEAVRASVPGAQSVAVDLQTIRWTDPVRGLRYIYLTPRIGQLALIDFDQGTTPEPFEMKLSRAAQITAMRGERNQKQAKRQAWRPIRYAISVARDSLGMTTEQIASGLEMSAEALDRILENRTVPSTRVISAGQKWVGQHPDIAEATASDPLEDSTKRPPGNPSAAGRARLRQNARANRETPEVIGGRPPPSGNLAKRRQFGLHHMSR